MKKEKITKQRKLISEKRNVLQFYNNAKIELK
jgi:hypothetical protein